MTKFLIAFLLFSANNLYAFELVCNGQYPRDPQQRPINVNCDSKDDIVNSLGAALQFLRKQGANDFQQAACWKAYQGAQSMHPAQASMLAKSYLPICNSELGRFK